MKKRDRRRTPSNTSLVRGKSKQTDLFDLLSTEAALPDSVELKADTASVKVDNTTSVLPSTLNGEGTEARVIPTLGKEYWSIVKKYGEEYD